MQNPILWLLNNNGIKPAEFAKKYGFSRQAIDYYINGTYPEVSDRLVLALSKIDEESEGYALDYLSDDYYQWRLNERYHIRAKYLEQPRQVWDLRTSPFDTYIKDTAGNRSRFAKDMKVPVRDVSRYANGEAVAMPGAIQDAFNDIEFPYVAELVAMQYNWRTEHR